MTNSVLAQLATLPEKTTPELKQLWRDLYDREPPPYNKPFLVKRLAYRIQELAYGGLSARAEAKLDGADRGGGRPRQGQAAGAQGRSADLWHPARPRMAGRRAYRHRARRRLRVPGPARTSRCRPSPVPSPARGGTARCSSASAIIGAASEGARPQNPRGRLHPRLDRRAARHGVQLARRPARGGAGRTSPARSTRAGSASATATTTAVSPAAPWSAPPCSGCCATSSAAPSTSSSSTRSTG